MTVRRTGRRKSVLKCVSRIVFFLVAILCIQAVQIAAFADDIDDDADYDGTVTQMTLTEFLSITGLDFEAYRAMMSDISYAGEYPHFLEENAQRYYDFKTEHPDIPFCAIIAYVNVNVDLGFYDYIEAVGDPYNVSALVNKNFALPPDWMPSDFVSIGYGHRLREEAAEQFFKMREAIREAGLRLRVISSFRSYQAQADNHRRGVNRAGLESADRQFARAGHSEHQMGLALDILHRSGFNFMTQANFEYTEEFAWLLENAHMFGFILRYPAEYTHIHGYIFEPWHWRYVGVEIATAMFDDGIVLFEEFYGRYLAADVLTMVLDNLLGYSELVEDEIECEVLTIIVDEISEQEDELTELTELFPDYSVSELIIPEEPPETQIEEPEASAMPFFAALIIFTLIFVPAILVYVVFRQLRKSA